MLAIHGFVLGVLKTFDGCIPLEAGKKHLYRSADNTRRLLIFSEQTMLFCIQTRSMFV